MLVPRAMLALEQTGRKTLAVAGGVAANSRIRAALQRETPPAACAFGMPAAVAVRRQRRDDRRAGVL